jgi:glycosyltransferase involved in cell wall biosynthesis
VPDVSVVIPTTGRPSVGEAVLSARAQSGISVEIIVVCDLAEVPEAVQGLRSSVDKVVCTGGNRGGSCARNIGIAHSGADYVAFLDDDDAWLPNKLSTQLPVAAQVAAAGWHPIVSSRILQRQSGRSPLRSVAPATVITDDTRPEEYLFRRRRPGTNRQALPTSTLLTTRRLAQICQWDESLPRHQDWDWIVRAARVPHARLVQIRDATTIYTIGSPGSVSARADWRTSWEWVKRWEGVWDNKTFSDFVAAQTLRYALQERDWRGAHVLLKAIRRNSRPSLSNAALAALGMVPRTSLERLAILQARIRPNLLRYVSVRGAE